VHFPRSATAWLWAALAWPGMEVARESKPIHELEWGSRCAKRLPCSKLGAKLAPSGAPLSMFARAALTGVIAAPGWERSQFCGFPDGPPTRTIDDVSTRHRSGGQELSEQLSPFRRCRARAEGPPITPRMQERPATNLRICSQSRHPMQLRNTTRPATGQQTG
jgi:hypothetical protein